MMMMSRLDSFAVVLLLMMILQCDAFSPNKPSCIGGSTTALQMGWLDNFLNSKSFPPKAEVKARHILCKKRDEANEALAKYRKGKKFAQLAKEYSVCPSGARGGDLGTFNPGQMVPDFDEAVFDPEVSKVGQLVGPVMTPFGYHLIIVDKRTGLEG